MKRSLNLFGPSLFPAFLATALAGTPGVESPAAPGESPEIDATTLHHKVLCGYQGWFRCPGDQAGEGWRHWSRDPSKITPKSLTFDMWPDMSDADADETFAAPGFTVEGGAPAVLFSSAHPKTVERHFRWMERYGIDGAFVQRFLVDLGRPSLDMVLGHVRASAAKTGRVYAVCYDLTDAPEARIHDLLKEDWARLVDELKLTRDGRYLHHGGKPVVFVWGFDSSRFGPALAHRIIDIFKADGPHSATLIGGCPWRWRAERDAEWARALRRFDAISPWNVGNYSEEGGRRQATTAHWADDLAEAKRSGMAYLAVIYPGFSWTNLKGKGASDATIPRLGGEFYWRQFARAADLGIDMAYVAMFDEVDEATAIFKVSNTPPSQAGFATYEGLPSDWYLRLTGEGSKVIRGERKARATLPIEP